MRIWYNGNVEGVTMNRWKQLLCMVVLLLAGCKQSSTVDNLAYDEYERDFNEISEITEFAEESDVCSMSYEMVNNEDGTYTYSIIVDEPRIAMYDVTVMAVEEGVGIREKMMPSIGIFDGPYAMIPSQINKEDGFVKGLAINGTTSQSPVVLRVMVEWEDRHGRSAARMYYRMQVDENGAVSLPLEGENA